MDAWEQLMAVLWRKGAVPSRAERFEVSLLSVHPLNIVSWATIAVCKPEHLPFWKQKLFLSFHKLQ